MDQDQNIHHPHDKGYKYLLSSKKAFIELLRSFIHRDWVEVIDEGRLVQLDKSYILPDFSEKEADLVYQLKLREHDVILLRFIGTPVLRRSSDALSSPPLSSRDLARRFEEH